MPVSCGDSRKRRRMNKVKWVALIEDISDVYVSCVSWCLRVFFFFFFKYSFVSIFSSFQRLCIDRFEWGIVLSN